MKAKNIFNTLALALLLTTACGKNESVNDERGYAFPLTINVTRQDDAATRATFNDGTKKLEFGNGDKLFVQGSAYGDGMPGEFAGTLERQSGGTFSGTIYTENVYSGTVTAILSSAHATLLPADYEDYDFLVISYPGTYSASFNIDDTKAFASSKAVAVEQFSLELGNYDDVNDCFVLQPAFAILNFTITDLTPSTEYAVVVSDGTERGGNVTTDGSGAARFAVGIWSGTYSEYISLTVGGSAIDLNLNGGVSMELERGHIYNITRRKEAASKALSAVTSSEVGWRIGSDGIAYEPMGYLPTGVNAVAIIAYVGSAGSVDESSATYKGLAVAMSNAGSACPWSDTNVKCLSRQTDNLGTALGYKDGISNTTTLTSDGHTHAAATAAVNNNGTTAPSGTSGWFLPSIGQWNLIVQGIATKKAGTPVTTDLTGEDNDTYKLFNLNSVITDAGGTGFSGNSGTWSSSDRAIANAWIMYFYGGKANSQAKSLDRNVRSVLAF